MKRSIWKKSLLIIKNFIRVNKFAADTMAVVLYLEKRKLPNRVKQIFADAKNGNAEIYIPSMVLVEIAYLCEKKKIETSLEEANKMIDSNDSFRFLSMTIEIIKSTFQITDIRELHDRIIAGSAKNIDAEIITNDPEIINSKFV